MERGDMDSIVKKPLHPYTKMMISAIPHTNPKERWTERFEMKVTGIAETLKESERGCILFERCPQATEDCKIMKPSLVEVEKNHYVACHSYSK